MRNAAGRGGRRSVGPRESWFKGKQPCSHTGDLGATRRQRAFFSFPPPERRPAYGPSAVLRVGDLNAVHKGARLRHRNLDKEQRKIVLVSGVSFSFGYAALTPFGKSVPFGTVEIQPLPLAFRKRSTVSAPRLHSRN